MIILDTETTNLIKNSIQPLAQQPRIVELTALKLDPLTLDEIDHLTFRANPGVPMNPEAVKITGITDADLAKETPFVTYITSLARFVCGSLALVAHNLSYDRDMLAMELARADRQYRFPWPPEHICTVEATTHLQGKRFNLEDLYAVATGRKMSDVYTAHRSLDDCRALAEIVRWLRKEGLI